MLLIPKPTYVLIYFVSTYVARQIYREEVIGLKVLLTHTRHPHNPPSVIPLCFIFKTSFRQPSKQSESTLRTINWSEAIQCRCHSWSWE